MEALLKKQSYTAGLIERFWDNVAKVGKDKLTKSLLTARLQLLETYWARFMEGHDTLIVLDDIDESAYMKSDAFARVEDAYVTVKARISSYLPTTKTGEATGDGSTLLKTIQLPKISLPSFSGDLLQWEGFRDLFKALVHDVAGLAPIQKMQYLRASLTGGAAAAVANIELSAEGYALAWEELTTQYDNHRVLVAIHMKAVLSAAPVTKPSATEINRLISVVSQASRSFQSLGRPVQHWDDWFVYIVVEKLDSATRLLWETSQSSSQDFPTFNVLKDFLLTRARALEAANPQSFPTTTSSSKPKRGGRDELLSHTTSTDANESSPPSPLCRERHALRACPRFKALSGEQRRDQVRKKKACFNCIGQGHTASNCPSNNRCRQCREKHHSLLHLAAPEGSSRPAPTAGSPETPSVEKPESSGESSSVATLSTSTSGMVLLATAMVNLIGESGRAATVRALLDSGSEASFVSEGVAQLLRLPRRRANVTVSGLQGVTTGRVTTTVSFMVGTEHAPSLRIVVPRALVLPKLTALTPSKQVPRGTWSHLVGLELADPTFDRPAAVEAVLGADVYGLLFEGGVQQGPPGEPVAHATIFGWVLMGALKETSTSTNVASHHVSTRPDIQEDLRRFWELEELPETRRLTPDEERCERMFAETHRRDSDRRYVVRLPRKEASPSGLGASRRRALQMLLSTERRLERDASLKERYEEFLASYLALGHMEPVPIQERAVDEAYYMPHHAVVKSTDPEGKIRVVFNASFQSSTGVSLNDVLLPGPKLQPDLWLVLSRLPLSRRLHQYAFTTDIVKMFRQIRIHKDDSDLQRILWRADPDSEVIDFRLTTVTYGTASAPYLAIRTLLQLARDEGHRFPQGAAVLRDNTYVDDVLAGASTLEEALHIQKQTVDLLKAEGFQLSKWASSHPQLCPDGDQAERLFTTSDGVGTLGILWTPTEDSLRLRAVPRLTSIGNPTKRSILSDVAKLYDPAGWAALVLITAKVFLQDLWTAGLDWDQDLPAPLRERWIRFASSLPELDRLRIPRWTGVFGNLELHAFSDASERAYAAVVYVRGTESSGRWQASLLVAKTKVAPVKPVTIPRLELCGALLAARLLGRTATGLGIEASCLHA